MSSEAEAAGSSLDSAKLVTAALLFVGAIAAFYYFADASRLFRVLGLVGAAIVALLIASQTAKGRSTMEFARDTQVEVRKVVWPTRQETVRTTAVVIVVVLITAVFLWVLDLMLGGITRWLMGHGG
jgi:preprotein translocase subunit SecE